MVPNPECFLHEGGIILQGTSIPTVSNRKRNCGYRMGHMTCLFLHVAECEDFVGWEFSSTKWKNSLCQAEAVNGSGGLNNLVGVTLTFQLASQPP